MSLYREIPATKHYLRKKKKELQNQLEKALEAKDANLLVGVIQEGRRIALVNRISESELPQIVEAEKNIAVVIEGALKDAVSRKAESLVEREVAQAEKFAKSFPSEARISRPTLYRDAARPI